jgi:hypothetical protein
MIHLELTPEEATLLGELLTVYLADYRREVAGTENPDFRHTLQRRCNAIEEFVRRLERAVAESVLGSRPTSSPKRREES